MLALTELLKQPGAFLPALLNLYACWVAIRRKRSQDLGDGAIQTLFGNRKSQEWVTTRLKLNEDRRRHREDLPR